MKQDPRATDERQEQKAAPVAVLSWEDLKRLKLVPTMAYEWVATGDASRLKEAFSHGLSVNAKQNHKSLLEAAITSGHENVLTVLWDVAPDLWFKENERIFSLLDELNRPEWTERVLASLTDREWAERGKKDLATWLEGATENTLKMLDVVWTKVQGQISPDAGDEASLRHRKVSKREQWIDQWTCALKSRDENPLRHHWDDRFLAMLDACPEHERVRHFNTVFSSAVTSVPLMEKLKERGVNCKVFGKENYTENPLESLLSRSGVDPHLAALEWLLKEGVSIFDLEESIREGGQKVAGGFIEGGTKTQQVDAAVKRWEITWSSAKKDDKYFIEPVDKLLWKAAENMNLPWMCRLVEEGSSLERAMRRVPEARQKVELALLSYQAERSIGDEVSVRALPAL